MPLPRETRIVLLETAIAQRLAERGLQKVSVSYTVGDGSIIVFWLESNKYASIDVATTDATAKRLTLAERDDRIYDEFVKQLDERFPRDGTHYRT